MFFARGQNGIAVSWRLRVLHTMLNASISVTYVCVSLRMCLHMDECMVSTSIRKEAYISFASKIENTSHLSSCRILAFAHKSIMADVARLTQRDKVHLSRSCATELGTPPMPKAKPCNNLPVALCVCGLLRYFMSQDS